MQDFGGIGSEVATQKYDQGGWREAWKNFLPSREQVLFTIYFEVSCFPVISVVVHLLLQGFSVTPCLVKVSS